jgi:hypothetical protein
MRFAAKVALIVFACPVYALMVVLQLARTYPDRRSRRVTFLAFLPLVALISVCWAVAWILISWTTYLAVKMVGG